MQYDLCAEPWIPVLCPDGAMQDVNLRTALTSAHQFLEIRDPIPTVEFGLYRLLVALVLDIFHPEDTEALGEMLDAGKFDEASIDRYFAQYADRFELFHPVYPFLQTGGMEQQDVKPLSGLLPLIPSGTNALHFHHAHESDFAVCPAAAARLLTMIAPFMTAGGAGLSPSINGAPPWYVLITGASLFETLCLNTCVVNLAQASGDAPPAWRQSAPVKAERYKHASLLQALTWQPRRIQLIPGAPGICSMTNAETLVRVSTMRFTAGAACDFAWQDPNVPYKITDKGPMVLRPQEGKELWRDTGPLLLLEQGDFTSEKGSVQFARPRIVAQFDVLINEGILNSDSICTVTAYGMRTDMKMKVFEWQRECLRLPAKMLGRQSLRTHAQQAMELADSVSYFLKQAIKHVYPRDGAGNNAAFDTLIDQSQRQFWQQLRAQFDILLDRLVELPSDPVAYDTELAETRIWWQQVLGSLGTKVLNEAIGELDTDAEAMRRQVGARQLFRRTIWNKFHPKPKPDNATPRRGKAAKALS